MVDIYQPELQRRFSEDFRGVLLKKSIIGQHLQARIQYQGADPKVATKSWIQYQAAIQQHLRRIFIATLLPLPSRCISIIFVVIV